MALPHDKTETLTLPVISPNGQIFTSAIGGDDDRIYFVFSRNRNSGQLVVFDHDLVRQESEEFPVASPGSFAPGAPATSYLLNTYRGVVKVGTNFYFVRAVRRFLSNTFTRIEVYYAELFPYTQEGDAGSPVDILYALSANRRNDPVSGDAYGLTYDTSNSKLVIPHLGNQRGGYRAGITTYDLNGSNPTVVTTTVIPIGLAYVGDGFYDANGRKYDTALGRVSAEDITLESDNTSPLGVLFANGQVIIVDGIDGVAGGGQVKLFYYGELITPTPPTPDALPIQQFRDFRKWTQKFDVVTQDADDNVIVVALNTDMVIQTTIRDLDLGSDVDISTQLASLTIIPKYTIPNAKVGDILFISTEFTDENPPTELPDLRYEIKGFKTIGTQPLRQEIIAQQVVV